MISIHKSDKQQSSKSLEEAMTTNSLSLFVLVGLLGTLLLSFSGFSSAYASTSDEEFDIEVNIDEDPIKRGDTQDITVIVRNDDTDRTVSDADVKLTVYPPDSDSTSATDETDDDGEADFKVEIDDDAETGEYDVKVRVSKSGYDTKTVNTSFDVTNGHHHDDNDDDDDNGDGNGSSASAASASSANGDGSAANSAASGGSSAASAASGDSAAAAAASPSAAAAGAASGGSSAASSAASGGSSSSSSSAAVSAAAD
jgi:hypothetical protein